MFGFTSELDGTVQFAPDVLCEFSGFKMSGFVLSPVCDYAARFGHNAILRRLGCERLKQRMDQDYSAIGCRLR